MLVPISLGQVGNGLTGWQIWRRLKMKLADAGFANVTLAPDRVLELLVDQMFEINNRTTISVDYLSFPTAANQRRYWLRNGAATGDYITALKILRASYDGRPVWPERAWQFDGDVESGTTTETGEPRNIWLEDSQAAATFGLPAAIGVWPLPDAVYKLRLVYRRPVPTYTNMNATLPIRIGAHQAVFTNVMAELFGAKDFHDNAMKAVWEQKRVLAERELYDWEKRMVLEHQPDLSARRLAQVE